MKPVADALLAGSRNHNGHKGHDVLLYKRNLVSIVSMVVT